jgi:UDP-N-acetylmuramoyl-tripeptide--D-alanyl-D-alanine ligase
LNDAAAALASLRPPDKRGEVIRFGNITVINDCYNSNPTALAAMVDALATMPATRRIVVAGEMLELGNAAEEMHTQAGESMAHKKKADILIGVRGLAHPMVKAANAAGLHAEFMETPEVAGDWLARNARDGDVVLLKASRGVKLERALEMWKAQIAHKTAQTK